MAINFGRAWSLCVGRTPQITLSDIEIHKPTIVEDIEEQYWAPYSDDGLSSDQNLRQPSNIRKVYTSFSELSEIIHQSLSVIHSKGKFPKGEKVLAVYKRYLEWYESLPDQLRLGHNSTPFVLFTQFV